MSIPPEWRKLPDGLGSSADPVGPKPFKPNDSRWAVWKKQTRLAEETVCRLESSFIQSPATTTNNRRLAQLFAHRFDVWSKRLVYVVWTDEMIDGFDEWLLSYARDTFALLFKALEGSDAEQRVAVGELRAALTASVKHWQAEARRYARLVSEQQDTQASGVAEEPRSPLAWNRIELKFLSDLNIQITVNAQVLPPCNYAEMGFEDRKAKKPNKAWVTLKSLAEKGGAIDVPIKSRVFLEKRMQEIRRTLRAYFLKAHFEVPPESEPLPYDRRAREYRSLFRITTGKSFQG